jgi:hypothetical protein
LPGCVAALETTKPRRFLEAKSFEFHDRSGVALEVAHFDGFDTELALDFFDA